MRGKHFTTREVPRMKNMELKSMQVNVIKKLKRILKDVLTYELARLIGSV